jgi:hypothetical protein
MFWLLWLNAPHPKRQRCYYHYVHETPSPEHILSQMVTTLKQCLKSILILSFHLGVDLLSGRTQSYFQTEIFCVFLIQTIVLHTQFSVMKFRGMHKKWVFSRLTACWKCVRNDLRSITLLTNHWTILFLLALRRNMFFSYYKFSEFSGSQLRG